MSPTLPWRPAIGAWPGERGVHFRVWAPTAGEVEVILETPDRIEPPIPLEKHADGTFQGVSTRIQPGGRYRYRVDGQGPFPDPASRYQPEGVHGPSEVVDSRRFAWSDAGWRGHSRDDLVIYELHVGTFTPQGTFASAIERLPHLVELGINAIELMPVADFPGRRNWGYDGVDLFAPARCYGTPDDLRSLVDAAHGLGLSVLLDVVYNHLGPDGNYLACFSPFYFSKAHLTPWGPAINLDGEQSAMVREFFLENALHWVHEYHIDGFRLDATHNLIDEGPRHLLAELVERVRESVSDRPIHLIAEDWRNLASMLRAGSAGGWGLDGVWVDDFHHELRRYLVGDCEGTFRDFRGSLSDLATTMNRGWLYCGRPSIHRECVRGSDPAGLEPSQFVYYLQNHDRIGNRAWGERLNHQVDLATYRAATALLLCAPATPLLFMGQEWASSAPFLFFTDHNAELGRLVREGRRHEFRHYTAFTDPEQQAHIPDVQDEATFLACKLNWDEIDQEPHASALRLYRALLQLRRNEPVLRGAPPGSFHALAIDDETILLLRQSETMPSLCLVARLKGSGAVDLGATSVSDHLIGRRWELVLSTEDPSFALDPMPPTLELGGPAPRVHFARPSAVILRGERTP